MFKILLSGLSTVKTRRIRRKISFLIESIETRDGGEKAAAAGNAIDDSHTTLDSFDKNNNRLDSRVIYTHRGSVIRRGGNCVPSFVFFFFFFYMFSIEKTDETLIVLIKWRYWEKQLYGFCETVFGRDEDNIPL